MDRKDMGAHIANDETMIKAILKAVTEAVSVPIWVKLTPSSSSLVDGRAPLTKLARRQYRSATHFRPCL